MLQSYTPSRNMLYRWGAKKIQDPSAKFEIRRNLNVGLRMTIIVSLFFQEQPLHFVILRPTTVIQASQLIGRRNWMLAISYRRVHI